MKNKFIEFIEIKISSRKKLSISPANISLCALCLYVCAYI
jgi:hypothetical protein